MNRKLAKEIGLILKRNSVGSIMGLENPEDIGSDWILVNWKEVVKEIAKLLISTKKQGISMHKVLKTRQKRERKGINA